MGQRNGPYNADFPVGTRVRIKDRVSLEAFMRDWKYHDPLLPEQVAFAGRVTAVKQLGYYHGGEELYWFEDIPGTWHEACLELAK